MAVGTLEIKNTVSRRVNTCTTGRSGFLTLHSGFSGMEGKWVEGMEGKWVEGMEGKWGEGMEGKWGEGMRTEGGLDLGSSGAPEKATEDGETGTRGSLIG